MSFRNSAHCVHHETRVLQDDGVTEPQIDEIIPIWDVFYNFKVGSQRATATQVLLSEHCECCAEPTRLLSINGNSVIPAVRFNFVNPPDCLIRLVVEDTNSEPEDLLLTDKHTVVALDRQGRRNTQWRRADPALIQAWQQFLDDGDFASAEEARAQLTRQDMSQVQGELASRRGDPTATEALRTYLTAVDFETDVYVERKNSTIGRVMHINAPERSPMICSLLLAHEDEAGNIDQDTIRDAMPINVGMHKPPMECQWLPLDPGNLLATMPFMEYFHNWFDFLMLRNIIGADALEQSWTGMAPVWPANILSDDPAKPELRARTVWGLPGADHAIFGNGIGNGTLTLQRMHHYQTLIDYSLPEIWQP